MDLSCLEVTSVPRHGHLFRPFAAIFCKHYSALVIEAFQSFLMFLDSLRLLNLLNSRHPFEDPPQTMIPVLGTHALSPQIAVGLSQGLLFLDVKKLRI